MVLIDHPEVEGPMTESARRLLYRVHAIERMVERGISDGDVREVLNAGKEIEAIPTIILIRAGWCLDGPAADPCM